MHVFANFLGNYRIKWPQFSIQRYVVPTDNIDDGIGTTFKFRMVVICFGEPINRSHTEMTIPGNKVSYKQMQLRIHAHKHIWQWKPTTNEDVSPIQNCDLPASHVSLQEGNTIVGIHFHSSNLPFPSTKSQDLKPPIRTKQINVAHPPISCLISVIQVQIVHSPELGPNLGVATRICIIKHYFRGPVYLTIFFSLFGMWWNSILWFHAQS